jgi:hypothetical protein
MDVCRYKLPANNCSGHFDSAILSVAYPLLPLQMPPSRQLCLAIATVMKPPAVLFEAVGAGTLLTQTPLPPPLIATAQKPIDELQPNLDIYLKKHHPFWG